MKNYALLLIAFLLLIGCEKSTKTPASPVDSPVQKREAIPELKPEDVDIMVILLKEHPDKKLSNNELAEYIQLTVNNSNGVYGTIIGDPKSFIKFTVDVFAKKTVTWKGGKLAGIGGQKPRIEIIAQKERQVQERGPKIIPDKGTRVGPNGDDLKFTVNSDSSLQKGDEEEYDIKINIKQRDSTYVYIIDPIIRYHPE